MDIVELGLLYDAEVEGPKAHVTYSLTSMGCPVGPMIEQQIREVVAEPRRRRGRRDGADVGAALEPGADVRRRQVHPRLRLAARNRLSRADSTFGELRTRLSAGARARFLRTLLAMGEKVRSAAVGAPGGDEGATLAPVAAHRARLQPDRRVDADEGAGRPRRGAQARRRRLPARGRAPDPPLGLLRYPEDDLAELAAGLQVLVRRGGLREREDAVDDRLGAAARDEVVDGPEVLLRPHRRADDGELLPPDAVEVGRRVRAARGAADGDAPARARRPGARSSRSPRRRAR